jgi:hypothetical protein
LEGEVVPVAVRICTLAKQSYILLEGELRPIKLVGCTKGDFLGDIEISLFLNGLI